MTPELWILAAWSLVLAVLLTGAIVVGRRLSRQVVAVQAQVDGMRDAVGTTLKALEAAPGFAAVRPTPPR